MGYGNNGIFQAMYVEATNSLVMGQRVHEQRPLGGLLFLERAKMDQYRKGTEVFIGATHDLPRGRHALVHSPACPTQA